MTKVDQNGTTHAYSFDLLGRMTADAVTLASGNPQNVDSSVLRIETSYNSQGLVDIITSFDATTGGNITNQVQNVYNGLGQLTSQFQEHAGAVNTSTSLHVDYGYSDLAHGARLASLTYPNGRVLTYNYGTSSSLDDALSRLTSISDGNTTLEGYVYLGLGTVVERDHPESGANLTYIKLSGESDGDAGDQYTGLDRFSRVVDQRWIDGSGTALDRYGYSYDRNSNRLTKSNSLNGNLSESYSYDDLNRLANMTRGGSAYQSWNLDSLGNMNSVTTGNVTETRTHNDQNQLLTMGNATLAFDNNGNTVADDQGHTLVYDAWNRLVDVKNGATVLETFTYDGQGWRITEAPAGGNATDLYYSSQWQVLEARQAGNTTAQNVWGLTYVDQLVLRDRDADQDASHTLEERLYDLQDANYNVTGLVNTSGTVAERYVLDPYGMASVRNSDWSVKGDGTVSASSFGWVYLHQGGRYDVVAGEYSFRNRDYSPTMMRWMQQDPISYLGGTLNVYAFAAISPIGFTDPLGLRPPTAAEAKALTYLDSFVSELQKAEQTQAAKERRAVPKPNSADSLGKVRSALAKAINDLKAGEDLAIDMNVALVAIITWSQQDPRSHKNNFAGNGEGAIAGSKYTTVGPNRPKCNIFVASVLFGASHSEVFLPKNGRAWQKLPPLAEEWGNGSAATYANTEMRGKYSFKYSITSDPPLGSIIAAHGHVGIYLGDGLYISARSGDSPLAGMMQPVHGVQIKGADGMRINGDKQEYQATVISIVKK